MSQAYQAEPPSPHRSGPRREDAAFWWSVVFSAAAALLVGLLLIEPARPFRAEALVLAGNGAGRSLLQLDDMLLADVVAAERLSADREFTGERGMIEDLVGDALDGLFGAGRGDISPERARQALRERASLRLLPGDHLVAVGVTARDPDRAIRLANALAQALVAARAPATTASVQQPGPDIAALAERLREARSRLAELRKRDGGSAGPPPLSAAQRQDLSARLAQGQARVAELETRLSQARRMSPTAPHPLDTPSLSALRKAFADLSDRQKRLRAELGPRHPLVNSLDDELASAARQIDAEIARVAAMTEAELETARASTGALEAAIARLDAEAQARDRAETGRLALEGEVEAAETALEAALRGAATPAGLAPPPIRVVALASETTRIGSDLPRTLAIASLCGLLVGSGIAAFALRRRE
jgi:polysaccharide biosynthesis transport protein